MRARAKILCQPQRTVDTTRRSQDLQDVPGKLGEFIQEENPVVCQAHLAGPRHARAAADHPGVRNGVVRRAEWPLAQEALPAAQKACNAVDFGGFDGFPERQQRQNAGREKDPAPRFPRMDPDRERQRQRESGGRRSQFDARQKGLSARSDDRNLPWCSGA